MSEVDRTTDELSAPRRRPAPAPADIGSFGPTLAAARRARGLSEADVAARLWLHVRQVRALESEELERLPQAAYVRGFVRNYAKLLDVPQEPLLASLNARLSPGEPLRPDDAGVVARSPVQVAAREHASRLAVIGGGLAALLLFAVAGWWALRAVESAPDVVAPQAEVPAAAVPSVERQAPPAAAKQGDAAQTPAQEALEATDSSPAAAAPTSAHELHFSFGQAAWVEVAQADGRVLLSRINDAGSQQTIVGTPPFRLVVGNASTVELEFRGKPVDLASVAGRDDVARLRLE